MNNIKNIEMIKMTKFVLWMSLFFLAPVAIAYGGQPAFRERVYLQTDKSFYLAGETLWFKTVTTNEKGVPIDFSKIVYIELLNDSLPVYKTMVDICNGQGAGMITLPPAIPGGMYRLCAYTRYMQPEGESVFFNKLVGVVNLLSPQPVSLNHPKVRIDENYSPVPVLSQNNIQIACDSANYRLRVPVKLNISGLPENLYSLTISVALSDGSVFVPRYNIFNWKNGLQTHSDADFTPEAIPEYEGHIIQGIILDDQTHKPISNQINIRTVLAFPGKEMSVFPGQTDRNGTVRFYTKDIAGANELVVSASEITDTAHRYRVDIFPPYARHSVSECGQLLLGKGWEAECSKRLLSQQVQEALRDSLQVNQISGLRFEPEKLYQIDDYTKFASVKEIINEYVQDVFVTDGRIIVSKNKIGDGRQNTLVLFDGVPVLNQQAVLQYNTKLLKSIAVYTDRYILGGAVYDGIVSFTTLTRNFSGLQLKAGTQLFNYKGSLLPVVFVAPVYDDKTKKASRMPDFRTTLHWDPNVKITGEEHSEIIFYTSDMPGKYDIRIEGLCSDGSVVSGKSTLTVR